MQESVMVRFLLMILVLLTANPTYAQRKNIQKNDDNFKADYSLGLATGFNNISGLQLEMTMKNRSGSVSSSTLSVIGGYSSRYAGFSAAFDSTGNKTKEWVHGLGAAVILTNFFQKLREGPFWSVGITGNLYFKKAIETTIDNFGQGIVLKTTNLKTFSVFGEIGYQWLVGRYAVRPHVGLGLMGSPFASTSSSDINGFLITAGCSLLLKL
jgi:hypothetical protein